MNVRVITRLLDFWSFHHIAAYWGSQPRPVHKPKAPLRRRTGRLRLVESDSDLEDDEGTHVFRPSELPK